MLSKGKHAVISANSGQNGMPPKEPEWSQKAVLSDPNSVPGSFQVRFSVDGHTEIAVLKSIANSYFFLKFDE